MTGILIITVIALALAAALEASNRRHADPVRRLTGTWTEDDRDVARTDLDLRATGAPAGTAGTGTIHHLPHRTPHARHAA